MKNHKLKTDSGVFWPVARGEKKFEIRLNDRDFQVGDLLILQETRFTGEEIRGGAPLEYTGFEIEVMVRHILYGSIYGLKKGWVIMSIEERV